jgi:hypothetical protein
LSKDNIIPNVVLQVLSCKKLEPNAAQAASAETNVDRYRVILSDGEYYVQGKLLRVCFRLMAGFRYVGFASE